MGVLCVYHASCSDGLAGLWVIQQIHPQLQEWGALHSPKDPGPEVTKEDDVIFVDFCYSLERMRGIAREAGTMLVIDHHESSKETCRILEEEGVRVLWDDQRSGCQLAWSYFFSEPTPRPEPLFITHIGDRDRWVWTHPDSRNFTAAMYANYDRTLDTIKTMAALTPAGYQALISEGAIINKINDRMIDRIARTAVLRNMTPPPEREGESRKPFRVWVCESNVFQSDVGVVLAEREQGDFALIWSYELADQRTWVSLRGSKTKNVNLSLIAREYGGGGHPLASGFSFRGHIDELFVNDQ